MAGAEVEEEAGTRLEYEETELRLGLPGGGNLKRGFSQTIDLKLNLNSSISSSSSSPPDIVNGGQNHHHQEEGKTTSNKPPAKAQVVGWPPVRSFRKNILAVQKSGGATPEAEKSGGRVAAAAFVKVSLDGAPYLRKVDLKMYNSYQQLSDALGNMFSSFTIGLDMICGYTYCPMDHDVVRFRHLMNLSSGNCGSQGLKEFMCESKLIDLLNGSDYVPTYEDKDGDWMLVGDVPWEMFVDSCKRLRIMKSSEAIGLAPRAVEKCKNRV